MTHYGTSSNVTLLLKTMEDDISAGLLEYAMTVSDGWIDTFDLQDKSLSIVGTAAELYAASFILGVLYDTSEQLSPQAKKYEEDAEKLLSSLFSPYSSSHTPNGDYLRHMDEPGTAPAMDMTEEKRNFRKVLNRDNGTW